jgi:hypothetical protein
MLRTGASTRATSGRPAGRYAKQSKEWVGIAMAVASLGATVCFADAARGAPDPRPHAHSAPPDQSWLKDVPEKPGSGAQGRIAVFTFKGDDVFEPVRAAVVRTLRKQRLDVTATLRRADSPAQYREMSYASNLAVFVDGEVSGKGVRQMVLIRLRSGVTGQYFATTRFKGSTQSIVGAIGGRLWVRVGSAIVRTCASAAKPRRRQSAPMYIEAGSPLDTPIGS